MKGKDFKLTRVLLYIGIFVTCVVILYPYFIMVITASKTNAEMYDTRGGILPKAWQLINFVKVENGVCIMPKR